MINNEDFEKINNDFFSKLSLKRNLYLFFAILDVIAAVIITVRFKNYYLLTVFGCALAYFLAEFFIYLKVIKKHDYVIANLTCESVEHSQFGYSFTNSKIYNFVINDIENQNPKLFYDSWNEKNNIKDPEEFSKDVQLQFVYSMRFADIKKSNREENVKYKKDDDIYVVFMTNKKRPLTFTNATMLVCDKLFQ